MRFIKKSLLSNGAIRNFDDKLQELYPEAYKRNGFNP